MYLTRFAAIAAILTITAGAAVADDTVPNPEFASWSKHKPGTRVTMKATTETGGMTTEALFITTLVEVGADKLVIEIESVVKAAGMEFKSPGEKRDVPKTFTVAKGPKDTPPAKKAEGKPEEGTETLKVAGMEVKTKWYKFKSEANGTKVESQTWMADDFPGMMVKSVTNTSGAGFSSKSVTEVVEFKKP
jgi:hypothetical protein